MVIENEEQYQAALKRIGEIHKEPYVYTIPATPRQELNELASATYIYERAQYEALGPILTRLKDERIFAIELNTNPVEFHEMCDECFGTTLTKADLIQLIAELQAIADKLP